MGNVREYYFNLTCFSESENGYANHESAPVGQLDHIQDTEQEVSSEDDEEEQPPVSQHVKKHYQTYNNHISHRYGVYDIMDLFGY